jgi:hypothetical protein
LIHIIDEFDERAVAATIDGTPAPVERQGELFRAHVWAGNTNGPAYPEILVETPANSSEGHVFIPAATVQPAHDDDGNLTSDGRWVYLWNAERCDRTGSIMDCGEAAARRAWHAMPRMLRQNRLVEMHTSPAAETAGVPYRQLRFPFIPAIRFRLSGCPGRLCRRTRGPYCSPIFFVEMTKLS